jgi:hypothetical protein
MANDKKLLDGVIVTLTDEEQAVLNAEKNTYASKSAERKLEQIREIRNQKLKDTDYLGLSDNSMSSDWIAKRKSWRDIPENYVDETAYDLLLVRNEDGKLTHTIWENA